MLVKVETTTGHWENGWEHDREHREHVAAPASGSVPVRELSPNPYRFPASNAAQPYARGARSGRSASHPLHSRPGNIDIPYTIGSTRFIRGLTMGQLLCYGARLSPGIDPQTNPSTF